MPLVLEGDDNVRKRDLLAMKTGSGVLFGTVLKRKDRKLGDSVIVKNEDIPALIEFLNGGST